MTDVIGAPPGGPGAAPEVVARVLIVEDDVFFQRVLQKRLESEGYKVMVAGDGRAGMKAIVSWEPDLVLSDWMMPEVDGLELCQSVKAGLREAAPYFILLTAKSEQADKMRGLATGADDYIVKPCDHGELVARIRAGLRIVRLAQELRSAVTELQMANAELTSTRDTLDRVRPALAVCGCCYRVRNDHGAWHDLENHVRDAAQRGMPPEACPECAANAKDLRREGTNG